MYILGLGFIVGTALGSFAKAIADRSLTNRSFWGRSCCEGCKKNLPWYDLLPVFSFFLLHGKCRYCRKGIGIEYLLVEVVMGVLIGYLFNQQVSNFQFSIFNFKFLIFIIDLLFKTFFITVLVALFLTDIKKMLIPDRVVLPAIVISIVFIIFITVMKITFLYFSLNQTRIGQLLLPPHSDYFQRHALMIAEPLFLGILMGVLIGGFFMALIIITRGKGMGGGDVKLGALMGLVLGFPNSILALMVAFLSGAIISLILIFGGKKHLKSAIPFGPFLVFGSLVALFFGKEIFNRYLGLDIGGNLFK
ncbi:MAG: Uncharacterized protein G01um10147_600 [Microgenomates group bacterium Gr01-1014_7]|nr:MAG: Uncharacterized protein G01um10147_600 [Microgenomates group bacterium Gr01-1014_7]